MVRCVECSNWTLKPREAQGKDDPLPDEDRARAAIGWGRCQHEELSRRWFFGETVPGRHCDRYDALPADQVQARRVWLAKQGEKS